MAARMWLGEGVNPYDPSVAVAAQQVIYGRPANAEDGENLGLLLYPLWVMIFYVPLSIAPYPLALAIWMTMLEIGLPLLVWLAVRLNRWRASPRLLIVMIVFFILSYHGMRAIFSGQIAVFESLLVVGGLLAIQREKDVAGGILLAVSLVKPHLSAFLLLFVILWSISMRRWRLLISLILSPLLLLGLCLLLSRDWMLMWLRSLVALAQSVDVRPPIIILGWKFGAAAFWTGLGLIVALGIFMIVEWFRALGNGDNWFQWTAALTLVTTCMLTLRTTSANMVLLIPAVVLVLKVWLDRKKSGGRISAFLGGLIVFAALWLLYIMTAGELAESPYLFLPVPLLAFIGLLWSRWWITGGPGVLVHSDALSWD